MAAAQPDDSSMTDPQPVQSVLGKRKREGDAGDEDVETSLFIPEENNMSLVLYGSNLDRDDDSAYANSEDEDEEDDIDEEDSDGEAVGDDDDEQQIHMESSEQFPSCAIYDQENFLR